MKTYCVYMHTLPSGKSYIGQTCNKMSVRTGKNFHRYGKRFRDAIKHYGVENAKTEILYRDLTLEEANRLEMLSIARWGTLHPYGYNFDNGGNSKIPSEDSRRRNSESHKGSKNARFGVSPSFETRRKISDANKGRKHSIKTRRTMIRKRAEKRGQLLLFDE